MDQVTLRWFSRDLNSRGLVVANALSDSVTQALAQQGLARLRPLFDRTAQDERLYALGLCSPEGRLLQSTERFPESLSCDAPMLLSAQAEPRLQPARRRRARRGAAHHGAATGEPACADRRRPPRRATPPARRRPCREAAASSPAVADDGPRPRAEGRLVLLHDLSFIDRRSQDTRAT
jgi:hypothetical protein